MFKWEKTARKPKSWPDSAYKEAYSIITEEVTNLFASIPGLSPKVDTQLQELDRNTTLHSHTDDPKVAYEVINTLIATTHQIRTILNKTAEDWKIQLEIEAAFSAIIDRIFESGTIIDWIKISKGIVKNGAKLIIARREALGAIRGRFRRLYNSDSDFRQLIAQFFVDYIHSANEYPATQANYDLASEVAFHLDPIARLEQKNIISSNKILSDPHQTTRIRDDLHSINTREKSKQISSTSLNAVFIHQMYYAIRRNSLTEETKEKLILVARGNQLHYALDSIENTLRDFMHFSAEELSVRIYNWTQFKHILEKCRAINSRGVNGQNDEEWRVIDNRFDELQFIVFCQLFGQGDPDLDAAIKEIISEIDYLVLPNSYGLRDALKGICLTIDPFFKVGSETPTLRALLDKES